MADIKSDIAIARAANKKPILEIGARLGIPAEQFPIDWKTVIFNMITIKGIYGRQMYETWYQMSNLLEAGVDISPVVTHRYSYKDFEKGFEAIKEGNCGKVVLDFEEM